MNVLANIDISIYQNHYFIYLMMNLILLDIRTIMKILIYLENIQKLSFIKNTRRVPSPSGVLLVPPALRNTQRGSSAGAAGGFTLPETLNGFRSTFNTMSMSLHLPLSSSQRHTCCKNVQASLTTPILHSSQFMPETPAAYSTPCKPYTALQFQHACSGRISKPSCTMLHHGVAWHARFALLAHA